MRPDDLPAREHFASLPCGTRAKYVAKVCRCLRCRAANAAYEAERKVARRQGDSGRLVPAAAARLHLRALSRAGVGRNAVRAACDVGRTLLAEIRSGRKTQIRASTERRILAVTREAIADHALVTAGATQRRLEQLLKEGFTKRELARRLGSTAKSPALQIGHRRVLARTAVDVERLFNREMADP